MTNQRSNSTRRDGYDQKSYSDNFESIFGSEKDRRLRADAEKVETFKHAASSNKSSYVAKSFEEFKSNVDGSIISDRKQLADHNKRNGVTNSADYSESYMNNRRSSISSAQERTDKTQRINKLKQTLRNRGHEYGY